MSFTTERARAAALIRHHPDNPGIADDVRRRLKMLRAERLIAELGAAEPVLTLPQRARLARLLLNEPGAGDAT